jgi:predicted homoserine dehydrogenase-like protein
VDCLGAQSTIQVHRDIFGLTPATTGLAFSPCGVDDLQTLLRPKSDGGILSHKGTVEVVSSIERDGRPVFRDLRWDVYVVIEAPSEYAVSCFQQYGLRTDDTGRYTAMLSSGCGHDCEPGVAFLRFLPINARVLLLFPLLIQ